MIFHCQRESRSCLVEDASEIDLRRRECYGVHSEDTKEAELDRENLIGPCDFHGNAHSEFFVFVFRRIFVLLDQESTASLQNAAIWLQLGPNLERAIPLNEAKRGVELQVRLEVFWERQLDFHGVGASVVENDLLSVELLVDEDVQIVLFLLNIDGHIDASAVDSDWDGLRVVLVLQEQREPLRNFSQLHRDKCELDLRAAVTVDFGCALETDLSEELFEDVGLAWLVVIFHRMVRHHDQSRVMRLVACRANAERASTVHFLTRKRFHIASGRLNRHCIVDALILVSFSGAISFRCCRLSVGALCPFFTFSIVTGQGRRRGRCLARLLTPTLLFLLNVVDGDEGNRRAIRRLYVDLGRQGSLVIDPQVLGALLSKDNISEVDGRVFNLDERFLAGANQRDVNAASFAQDGEH